MKVTYDNTGGAAYIYVEPLGRKVAHTEARDDGVNIDTDIEGNIVGIELLNVTDFELVAS